MAKITIDNKKTLAFTKKLSKSLTKDFTKMVKNFVKTSAKGGHANLAYVIGYLDAVTGRPAAPAGIPDSKVNDYSKGWSTGAGKAAKRKNASAAL